MNNKSTLIMLNLTVLGLIVFTLFGFYKYSNMNYRGSSADIGQQRDEYAYLTTSNLKSMPPLPDTLKIIPTGKVKEFSLEASEAEWELLPGVKTEAVTYNGQTPGPVIRVTEGDMVRITIKNSLQEETSIHFHGMHLPNKQDGVPPFTQNPVKLGETFTYEFIAGHAGTYMYHPHINSVEQIDKGLYGAFIIDPQEASGHIKYDKEYVMVLAGWNVPSGSFDRSALTDSGVGGHDAMNGMEGMKGKESGSSGDMSMSMNYNFWTINGKVFPATEKITVAEGDRVRVRFINISNAAHPMHMHGTDFRIIAEDSHPLAQPKIVNTVDVAPGKTFDIDFIADNPGQWVLHCHELHHTENDGVEPGGLMTIIEFEGTKPNEEHKDM